MTGFEEHRLGRGELSKVTEWKLFLSWVRGICEENLDSDEWQESRKKIPLTSNDNLAIHGELYAPFRPDEMGEDFLGGINVSLVAKYPKLEKVIVDARRASGDQSPYAPLSVSFAQLLPRDVVFAGNVFPFTRLRDYSTQVDEMIGYCETLLHPIYDDLRNYESLSDWQNKPNWRNQFGWLVITAAYAVTTKDSGTARKQVREQLEFLETYEPLRKRSSVEDISKMADMAVTKTAAWTKQDLFALAATLRD
jgi:hypothetical protein